MSGKVPMYRWDGYYVGETLQGGVRQYIAVGPRGGFQFVATELGPSLWDSGPCDICKFTKEAAQP